MSLTKIQLSASSYGRGIKVVATSIASGTTIHAAQATTTAGLGDEVVLYATNSDTVVRVLTIGFGGTTAPDDLQTFTIQPGACVQVCAGLLLMNALVVVASGSAANIFTIHGFVTRSS